MTPGTNLHVGCECSVAAPYLVVHDNNACGGANVSFSELYRRKG